MDDHNYRFPARDITNFSNLWLRNVEPHNSPLPPAHSFTEIFGLSDTISYDIRSYECQLMQRDFVLSPHGSSWHGIYVILGYMG